MRLAIPRLAGLGYIVFQPVFVTFCRQFLSGLLGRRFAPGQDLGAVQRGIHPDEHCANDNDESQQAVQD